jgi:recombination protein RecA
MGKNKKKIGVLLAEKDLKRRYPDSGLASVICLPDDKSLRLPCRVVSINYHLGGGLPYGKVLENFGEESTGKSLLAMDFGVVAQSLGGVVLWIDSEAAFDPVWMVKHGLDISKIQLLPYENRIEIISDWIADYCIYWRSKLTNNQPILMVLDSIAVLEAMDVMETAQIDTKAEMGRRSFKMGEMLRKRTRIFAKYGICVYFINQLRKKIGASQFEDPDTTPMAQCMKYYASQRFGLYRGKRLKAGNSDKGKWVGNVVYVRTKKNKTSAPRDNVKAKVFFKKDGSNFGYSKYHGFGEILHERGILEMTNIKDPEKARFIYKGKVIARGEEAFIELLVNNDELRSKFIKRVGVNTASLTRKKLESLTTNLYPVKLKKSKDEEEEE